MRQPLPQRRRLGRHLCQQPFGITRLVQPRPVNGEAEVGSAVLLAQQPRITAIKEVKLDCIADASGERWGRCKPDTQPDRRVGSPGRSWPCQPAHIVLATGEEQRVGGNERPIIKPHRTGVYAAHSRAALHASTRPLGCGQHQPVKTEPRHRPSGLRERGLGNAAAREEAHMCQDGRIERLALDPEAIKHCQRSPAKKPAAKCVAVLARALQQ